MTLPHHEPTIVLIPARNEAPTITQVITEIKESLHSPILVIDDASVDDTGKVARTAGAKVVSLSFSLGAWGAIQTGLRYALAHGFNTAITMDADGQHEADSISSLLAPIVAGQCEVVIGSYPQRGSFSRQLAWSFFRRLTRIEFRDLTSGLRAYSHPAITLLASRKATLLDYQDMGVLMLLREAGLRIQEVPVFMYPRMNGHSRVFNTWWTVSQYMLHTSVLCLARGKRSKKKN